MLMEEESENLYLHVPRDMNKMDFYVIHCVRKVLLESDLYAGKIVQLILQTRVWIALNQQLMEEVRVGSVNLYVNLKNIKDVNNGDYYGTLNVDKIFMHLDVVFAHLTVL